MDLSELAIKSLQEIVVDAWTDGKSINLSGIGYGRVHWGDRTDVRDDPSPYYYFLAGMVRRHRLNRILEIGTHWAGATRAMWHGITDQAGAKVVTVDITTESDNRLNTYPQIRKIVGDGNSEETFNQVLEAFDHQPVDLVYIDAAHQTMPTFTSYALYAMALRPQLMVFDDINLNEGMRKAWSLITASLPENQTINAADVVRAIRPSADNPGFGVVRFEQNIRR